MRVSLLFFGMLLAGLVQGQDPPKGAIEGTVLDEVTGEPIRRAAVIISGSGSRGRQPESTVVQTQADGKFRFEGLAAGNFYVMAQKSGYVAAAGPGRPGVQLQLTAAEQKTGITIKLTPQGIISGRVFDDEGDPVQSAQIQILQRRKTAGKWRWQPMNGSATNDRGEYRVANLMAGDYAVAATYNDPISQMNTSTPVRQVYATTYYPNGSDVNSAQTVTVQKGGETAGIDVRMTKEAAYRLRVRVEGVSAEQLQQVNVNAFSREEGMEFRGRMGLGFRRLEPGLFEAMSVRAGSWYVQAQVYQQGGEPLMGVTPVEVSNADVMDVVVRIGSAQAITGTFVFEGTPPEKMNWKNHYIQIGGALGRSFGGGRATVTDEGTFTVTNNMPGKYAITVQGPRPPRVYLASIKVGAEEYLGKEIDLTNGLPGPLKIIYRGDAATVTGKLEGEPDTSTDKRGIVVMVPVETHLRRMEFLQVMPVRPDGSFQSGPAVRPGEYLVCHMPGDQQTLYEDGEPPKESMEAAVRLKVESNGTHTVQVKAVKAAAPQ